MTIEHDRARSEDLGYGRRRLEAPLSPIAFRISLALVITLPAAVISLTVLGCDAGLAHPFGAYPYDPDGDCLGASGVVDVLDGPAPPPCDVVRCFQAPSGSVFVTDQACDAPLDFHDRTEDPDGPCVKALGAYAAEGHGRCPRASHDGGTGGSTGGGS